METVFPELTAYRGRVTRLHPRPGLPGARDSHVGGPMLWPYDEPWPVCHEQHQRETEGYAPDEILTARASGGWPPSRPWPADAAPGTDAPVPFGGLAQLFCRDVPGLPPGPDGADLAQIFRCPFVHGLHHERRYHLRWRKAEVAERAGRFLDPPPRVPLLRSEHELPEPCVLHPEEVDTYPWAEDGVLPGPLIARIDAWDDAQISEHGPHALNYQGALSIPPGWRVGGLPSWASTGPMAIDCASCATPMRLLLTAGERRRTWIRTAGCPWRTGIRPGGGMPRFRAVHSLPSPLGSDSDGTGTCTSSSARPTKGTRPDGYCPEWCEGYGC